MDVALLGRGRKAWQYENRVSVLLSTCMVDNAVTRLGQSPEYQAIWDTGTTISAVSKDVVQDRRLVVRNKVKVNTAAGETEASLYIVNLPLPEIADFWLPVLDAELGGRADALIGMDIISQGEFTVRRRNRGTQFSFSIRPRRRFIFF